jgi:hypothetical protein
MIIVTSNEDTKFVAIASGVSSAQYNEVAFVFSIFIFFFRPQPERVGGFRLHG